MTLQKLLLGLSKNKQIRVECFVCDGVCRVEIADWYTSHVILRESIELDKEITDYNKFIPFL